MTMSSQNDTRPPDDFGTALTSESPATSDAPVSSQNLPVQQERSFQSSPTYQSGPTYATASRLGEELRQWQVEARRAALQPLFAPILLLAQRLLAAHRNWEVQEQMHLDYLSLEVRVRPDAEPILIECRLSEDVQLQGKGALELRVAAPPSLCRVARR